MFGKNKESAAKGSHASKKTSGAANKRSRVEAASENAESKSNSRGCSGSSASSRKSK